jgi:nicotinate-nucleotide adenylyltransferase
VSGVAATRPPGAAPASVVPGAIGILGGTFDPIHVGHLAIAEHAREVLGLERVLFVPAPRAPLRDGPPVAPAAARMRMVELATAANPRFGVDPVELDRPGPSYTSDTLQVLHDRAADEGQAPDLWFILSAEQLRRLPDWRSPDRILALARLAVVPRPGSDTPDRAWVDARFPGRGDRIAFVGGPLLDVSGSDVRTRLRDGWSVRYLVPDAVIGYIEDHGLYRT